MKKRYDKGRAMRIDIDIEKLDPNLKNGIQELIYQGDVCLHQEESRFLNFIQKPASREIKIVFESQKIKIFYTEINDIFRALGNLISLEEEINTIEIVERRRMSKISVMIDTSRNAVMKVNTIKKFIRYAALFGFNALMLYTEDTFEVEDEPYFGYMRGSYTKDEISELDSYAQIFGIEMIPCIQTLAHLQRILRYESYSKIKDTSSVLLCDNNATYDFIEKMISNAIEPYSSKQIHIGMDEAMDLGRGAYLDKFGYSPAAELMKNHLQKVVKITKSLNLEPMMWSDMFFRAASPERKYFAPSINIPPEISKTVPENIKLVYWDYFHTKSSDYERMIKEHLKLSAQPPVIAPGLHTWNRFWPAYSYAMPRIESALNAGLQYNLQETILTIWGDDGTECDFNAAIPLMKFATDIIFTGKSNLELTDKSIKKITGYSFATWRLGEGIDLVPGNETVDNIGKMLLWEDPLTGLCQKQKRNQALNKYYSKLKESIQNKSERDHLTIPWCLCDVLELKADLPEMLKNAYKNKDKRVLGIIRNIIIPELIIKISNLEYEHRLAWHASNKPFGWDVLQRRYGGLKSMFENLALRLEGYSNKEFDKIEELEIDKLLLLHTREDGFPLTACYNHFFTTSYHGH